MQTTEVVQFLSLPAPRQIPAALQRLVRDAAMPPMLRYIAVGVTLLSFILSFLILYMMLIQFRLWHDLVLDIGNPASAQGKVISVRYISPTRKASEDMVVGFIFMAANNREFLGVCSQHQYSLDKGDRVQIEYLETNPSISRITGGTIRPRSVTYSIIIIPLLILPFSLLPFLILHLQTRYFLKLFAEGIPVAAAVQNVVKGSRGYYRATISYVHDNTTCIAHEYVRKQIADMLQNKMSMGAPVTLVIDPAVPKKYFLLEKIPSQKQLHG